MPSVMVVLAGTLLARVAPGTLPVAATPYAKKLGELLGATVLETVAISKSGVMAVETAALALPRGHAAKLDPVEAERKLEALDSNALYEQVEDILAQVVQTEVLDRKSVV